MGSFESFDGRRLSYDADGSGPVVVLLHGYASDSYINWVRPGVIAAITRSGFRAVALDLRGHGMSDKPHEPEAYGDGAMVKDAAALVDHLECDRVMAVGFSMGAMTTATWASDDKRVRGAVLAGIGAHTLLARGDGPNLIAEAMLAEDKSTITNEFAKSFRDFADLTRADRKALAAVQNRDRPMLQGLEKLDIPVLVLGADNDPLAGDPQGVADKIAGATTAVVGGTHLNVVNNPQFHTAVVDFLVQHRNVLE